MEKIVGERGVRIHLGVLRVVISIEGYRRRLLRLSYLHYRYRFR